MTWNTSEKRPVLYRDQTFDFYCFRSDVVLIRQKSVGYKTFYTTAYIVEFEDEFPAWRTNCSSAFEINGDFEWMYIPE